MNGKEGGGNGEGTPPAPPTQDRMRPLSGENLDLAARIRTVAYLDKTPSINTFLLSKAFSKDIPLWVTKAVPEVRAKYEPGHDFTELQNYLEKTPLHEKESVLAGLEEWLDGKFAHRKGTRPRLFLAKFSHDFFVTWTDSDPERTPPAPGHRA